MRNRWRHHRQRVMPRQNEEVNEIWLCDKGRFAYHYTESKKRLSKPMIREDQKLVRASWDAATKLAADNFIKAKKDFVILASGRLFQRRFVQSENTRRSFRRQSVSLF